MNFQSKILNNTKISEHYFDGDYKFDFLPNIIAIQYAITNTVEKAFINEVKTNRFDKFTDLENLCIKLINFLDKNEFENYKAKMTEEVFEAVSNLLNDTLNKNKK